METEGGDGMEGHCCQYNDITPEEYSEVTVSAFGNHPKAIFDGCAQNAPTFPYDVYEGRRPSLLPMPQLCTL